MMVLSTMK